MHLKWYMAAESVIHSNKPYHVLLRLLFFWHVYVFRTYSRNAAACHFIRIHFKKPLCLRHPGLFYNIADISSITEV